MPSKPLSKPDATEFLLAQEALAGDDTNAVNVERIMHHDDMGWIVFEFLKLGSPLGTEDQEPYYWRDRLDIDESHPNSYWHRNARKFISLWNLTQQLDGTLFLVNYSISETESFSDVPDDCSPQPYTRINREDEEEKIYYYIDKDKGVYVMEVEEMATDPGVSRESEPVVTHAAERRDRPWTWDEFSEWFRDLNANTTPPGAVELHSIP